MRAQVGDVIRWDRGWGHDLKPPLWTLIAKYDGDFLEVALNDSGSVCAGEEDMVEAVTDFPLFNDSAEAEIINPSDWPDWVFTAVAKYRLLGEL
jgi:hypothetical protein